MPKGSSFAGSRARFSFQKAYFEQVAQAYLSIKSLSPVVASNLDADAPTRSKKLSFDAIHYLVDVEHATEAALRNLPDTAELQKTWFKLIAGDATVDLELAKRTIRRCAEVYATRRLDPAEYFRQFRQGRPIERKAT